ncbi:hypothetical protein EGI26_10775 [Lacihabitans sp. CCS-44]|nr:hypothetical protein [Lacihabitans sp. CCS-44]
MKLKISIRNRINQVIQTLFAQKQKKSASTALSQTVYLTNLAKIHFLGKTLNALNVNIACFLLI